MPHYPAYNPHDPIWNTLAEQEAKTPTGQALALANRLHRMVLDPKERGRMHYLYRLACRAERRYYRRAQITHC